MKNEDKYKVAMDKMAEDFIAMAQNYCDECDIGSAYDKAHEPMSCFKACKEIHIKHYLELSEGKKSEAAK